MISPSLSPRAIVSPVCRLVDTSTRHIVVPAGGLGGDRWHYCAVCEAVSPPRAWHCAVCGVCILKATTSNITCLVRAITPCLVAGHDSLPSSRCYCVAAARAPLHVRRLLCGALQPPLLPPLPGLDVARRDLLHLFQLAVRVE